MPSFTSNIGLKCIRIASTDNLFNSFRSEAPMAFSGRTIFFFQKRDDCPVLFILFFYFVKYKRKENSFKFGPKLTLSS